MRKYLLVLFVIVTILITACSEEVKKDSQEKQLEIHGWTSAIGAVEGNYETQSFSYTIFLTNEKDSLVNIKWIEPILGEKFKNKVIENELKININKDIPSKEYIEIEGEIIFDAKGMSKQEIVELEPFITYIRVMSDEVVDIKIGK
jgi:hypothetical protein